MAYSARVLLDSVSPGGARLVTLQVTYPRFIHAEMMTHRVFSRNAASSRAIPVKKMIAAVRDDPAMPVYWGKNQSGMSARVELDDPSLAKAQSIWRTALENALRTAEQLSDAEIDLHKQLVNRVLEPFAWITVIITATQWANFFTQRLHPDAQPEICRIASLMWDAFEQSAPSQLAFHEWHTPLILDDERGLDAATLCRLSVARCARVSYLTHDGTRDRSKDLELYDRLLEGGANGHWSPFEHVASPLADSNAFSGNFRGWQQYRKLFADENANALPDERTTLSA